VEEEPREVGTRLRILDAAIACFTQFGNEKTTLDNVARVAGLARQTIYRYFPNRAALLEGVRDLEDARLRDEVARIAGCSGTLEDFIAELVAFQSVTVNRYHTRQHLLEFDLSLVRSLFLSREHRAELLRELVAPAVEVAHERGELMPGLDVAEAAEWIAITLGTLSTLTKSATFDLEDAAAVGRFYARHICRGLGVKSTSGAPR
jgi:AcrR family transcriptional regulator